jgi:hypothetical protein
MMIQQARDESLPRVTDVLKFLYAEEFESIPDDILEEARERGERYHKLIELNWNTKLDHPIVNMFREGLDVIIIDRTMSQPAIEMQINGLSYTGKPDFCFDDVVIDYKFTRDRLRPVTALQLLLYGGLIYEASCGQHIIKKYYAFHYHQDGGLFVYKIPDRAIEPLGLFAVSLVRHHADIEAGKIIRYDKLIEWERLQLEYDVFDEFYCTMPPAIVTNELEEKAAIYRYRCLQKVEAYQKHLGREITRRMEETGQTKLYDHTGGGVRLQTSNRKQHDSAKLKAYKKTIVTGTKESTSLVRFNPPKNEQKLIN